MKSSKQNNNQVNTLFFLIPSLATGGAERQVSYLQQTFLDCIIVCLEKTDTTYEIDNSRVIYLNHSIGYSKIKKVFSLPLYIIKLYKILKPIKQRVTLISFMEYSNIISFILSFFIPINAIVSVRNTISKHYLEKSFVFFVIHKIAVFIYKKVPVIVTNSIGAKNDLIDFGVEEKKIHVIHNMYDINNIIQNSTNDIPKEIINVFSFPTLLCVGRLNPQKGQEHLIKIIKTLKQKNYQLKLIIVGEGKLKKHLMEVAINAKLFIYDWEKDTINNNYDVYFMGNMSNPYAIYKKCTIFTLPSLYEGFPNVLIEAGICGATCISANCPSGPSELFIEQTLEDIFVPYYTPSGVLIPAFDSGILLSSIYDQWSNVIIELLQNEKLRNEMKESLQKKTQKFSIEKVSQEWAKIINK